MITKDYWMNCATKTDPRRWALESRAAHSTPTENCVSGATRHLLFDGRLLKPSSYGKRRLPLKVTSAASNCGSWFIGRYFSGSRCFTSSGSSQLPAAGGEGSMVAEPMPCRTTESLKDGLDPMKST